MYKFINGYLGNYFVEFPIDDHPEKISDFKNELEKYEEYFRQRFEKEFSNNWLEMFENMSLSKLKNDESLSEQKDAIEKELNPWGEKIPELKNFKKAIFSMIKEDGFTIPGNLNS